MNFKLKGHFLAIITILIWSSTFIVSKVLLQQMSPLQILFFRFLMAVIFLSILSPKFKKPVSIREELFFLAAGGTLALYFFFENSALKHTYSSNVSLIVSTIPLITGGLSSFFYKTHFFNRKRLIGFIAAYVGVFLIIINGKGLEGIEPLGDIFAFIASLMFAVYSLLMPKIQNGYNLIELTRKVFFYGLITLSTIIFILQENIRIEAMDSKLVMSMLFLGIVASSLAFLMWNKAIQSIGSIKTNQYIYLVPIVTTILSAIIIKEKITIFIIIGTALILFGLYNSEKK
ncbi:MAG: DMT family transporter [Clostridiaceae bacterium]|nr:DMT family transporter [Clostridiaceae bacterium]